MWYGMSKNEKHLHIHVVVSIVTEELHIVENDRRVGAKVVGYAYPQTSDFLRVTGLRFWFVSSRRHPVRGCRLRVNRFSIGTILCLFLLQPFLKVIFVEGGVTATPATPSWATATYIGTKGIYTFKTIIFFTVSDSYG